MLGILKDLVIAGASVAGDGLAARRAHATKGDTLLARDRSPRGRTLLVAALALIGLCVPSGKAAAAAQLVEYYHLDALGNARVVTNDQGAVIERHDYLPFGEEWCGTAVCGAVTPGQPRRFTGKERDVETGLDYFGARYLRANLGRFTTRDPVFNHQAALFDPQRWNRYTYVSNRPLRYVDPDGREQAVIMGGKTYMAGVDGLQAGNERAKNIVFGALFAGTAAVVIGFTAPELVAVVVTKAADPRAQQLAHETLEGLAGGPPISPSVARLPIPPYPSGMTLQEFGKQVMGWGGNSQEARERIATLTAEELQSAGVTQQMASAWRKFYENEVLRNPANPSAAGRVDLMKQAETLLKQE